MFSPPARRPWRQNFSRAMGKRKDVPDDVRGEVYRFLCERLHDGKLRTGSIAAAASSFGLHRNTVSLIWKNPTPVRQGRPGAKPKYVLANVKAAMEKVPPRLRQTIRSTAAHVGLPKSSFADLLGGSDEIRSTSTRIKPRLRPDNMTQRLGFILPFVAPGMTAILIFV